MKKMYILYIFLLLLIIFSCPNVLSKELSCETASKFLENVVSLNSEVCEQGYYKEKEQSTTIQILTFAPLIERYASKEEAQKAVNDKVNSIKGSASKRYESSSKNNDEFVSHSAPKYIPISGAEEGILGITTEQMQSPVAMVGPPAGVTITNADAWTPTVIEAELVALIGRCEISFTGWASFDPSEYFDLYEITKYPPVLELKPSPKVEEILTETMQKVALDIITNIAPECEGIVAEQLETSSSFEQEEASTFEQEETSAGTESLPIVEALVETVPKDSDLQISSKAKSVGEAIVTELDGLADIQLPDGTWKPIEQGDILPVDAVLYTSYASEVKLEFSNHMIMFIRALSNFSIKEADANPELFRTRLDFGVGEIRFKVLEGDFETDMQVEAPKYITGVVGTDFAISYNNETEESIIEVYDGTVDVTNKKTNEKSSISSQYGSDIKRIEVDKDGVMVEKIAIPSSELQEQSVKTQEDGGRIWLIILIVVLVIGVGVYFLYKKKRKNKP